MIGLGLGGVTTDAELNLYDRRSQATIDEFVIRASGRTKHQIKL